MNELHTRCLDLFPEWLRALAPDAVELSHVLASTTAPETTRRYVAGGLNYLFKSLDLIPDGIEDLGFLDDAFVIRVAAQLSIHEAPGKETAAVLVRLAADTKVIAELLGKDYVRLEVVREDADAGDGAGADGRRDSARRRHPRGVHARGHGVGGELRDAELLAGREEPGEAAVVPGGEAAGLSANG